MAKVRHLVNAIYCLNDIWAQRKSFPGNAPNPRLRTSPSSHPSQQPLHIECLCACHGHVLKWCLHQNLQHFGNRNHGLHIHAYSWTLTKCKRKPTTKTTDTLLLLPFLHSHIWPVPRIMLTVGKGYNAHSYLRIDWCQTLPLAHSERKIKPSGNYSKCNRAVRGHTGPHIKVWHQFLLLKLLSEIIKLDVHWA